MSWKLIKFLGDMMAFLYLKIYADNYSDFFGKIGVQGNIIEVDKTHVVSRRVIGE